MEDPHLQDSHPPWCPPEPWSFVGEQILFAHVGRILRNSQAGGNFPNLLLVGSRFDGRDLENQKFLIEVKAGGSSQEALVVKNPLASVRDKRDLGLILGSGRSLGGEDDNPIQYSCMENPHGQRSLAGCSTWGCKESDTIERLSTAHYIYMYIKSLYCTLQICYNFLN